MSSLYDVQCNATIPYQVTGFYDSILPKQVVASQSCNNELAVAGNGELTLIVDNGATCSASLKLDCPVDALSWSHDGKYLAVVDSLGSLHVLSRSDLKVLYSERVDSHERVSGAEENEEKYFCSITFACSRRRGLYDLAIGCVSGRVIVYEDVDLNLALHAYALRDSSLGQRVKQQIKKRHFNTAICHNENLSGLTSYHSDFQTLYFTSGLGKDVLVSWEMVVPVFGTTSANDDHYVSMLSVERAMIRGLHKNSACVGFRKIFQVFSFIFALDDQGHLYQFDLTHLILLKWWRNVCFLDVIVKMPCSLKKTEGLNLCKIYGITKNPKTDKTSISIYKMGAMEQIFTVPCNDVPIIASKPIEFDDMFYVDVAADDEDRQLKLWIKNLRESSPDSRLLLLLQQRKYKEAEEFATKFTLSLQPVYQQEASFLLRTLSTMSDEQAMNETFTKFKQCIAKVTDALFIGELCISVSLADLSLTFQLLTLAREYLDSGGRYFRASLTDDEVDDLQLRLEIDRKLDLLVTFRMAFKNADSSSWQSFSTKSLPGEVASLLVAGSLQAATVICSRHENELVAYLEEDGDKRFLNLLKVVSEDADTDELVSWLEQIIPAVLSSSIPKCIEILASWLCSRAVALEEIFPEKWPENGLKLANVFFNVQKKLSRVGFIREQLSPMYLVLKSKKEEVSQLRMLVSRLQLLSRLQMRYHCQVSLEEFVKETTVTLSFRMLDKVTAPELVAKCLLTTVRPYMKEHKLNEDETLLQYIQEVLAQRHEHAWGAFQSLHERKVIAIIKCLEDEKVIVESTTVLAKKASIPWSTDVNTLVRHALKLTGESCQHSSMSLDDDIRALYKNLRHELLNCVHLERVPSITAKYDLSETVHRDDSGYERLVRILVKHDSNEALNDAVEIARTFTDVPEERVYIHRINHLIEKQRISECVDVLDHAPNIAMNLVNHTVLRTTIVLERTHSIWATERANHCLASINMIERMLRGSGKVSESTIRDWMADLAMFRSIYALQKTYGELMSVESYNNKSFRDSVLARHVVLHYENKSTQTSPTSALIQSNVADSSDVSCANNNTFMNQSKRSTEMDGAGDAKVESQPRRYETFASILNLARLLNVQQETMRAQIALQAAAKCQGDAAIGICKELYYTSPSHATASTLHIIALTLLRYLETHPEQISNLLPDIYDIASAAATCCHRNQLLNVIALFNLCSLSRDIQRVTDASTQAFLSKCMTAGPKIHRSSYEHGEWLHDWYDETDGLALRSVDVLPMIAQLTDILFNKQGVALLCTQPTQSVQSVLRSLAGLLVSITSLLKNARRCTMSLQWVIKTQYIIVTHLSNHKAFYGDSKGVKTVVDMVMQTMNRAKDEMKAYIETLVEKVLLARNPDIPYAIGLLMDLPPDSAFQLLNNICQSAGSNYTKITALARTGLEVSRLHGVLTQIPRYESLLLDAKWAHELNAITIPVDGVLFSTQQWKQKLLLKLITHPSMTGSILLRYCTDYKLDCDHTLLQYVNFLLGGDVTSNPDNASIGSTDNCLIQFSQYSNNALLPLNHSPAVLLAGKGSGNTEAEKEKISWEKIKEELKWLTRSIVNKHDLLRQFERCLRNNMCPYDYDRAEFMLQLIRSCSSADDGVVNVDKGLSLIGYLRHVERERPPTDYEVRRMWRRDGRENFSQKNLPRMSQNRLPIHPLLYGDASQAWKILSGEVSERSAERLAPVAKLIKLSEDKLYMTAADNVITRYANTDGEKIKLTSRQLEQVQSLTERITSHHMAVAMAKRIAEILPIGEEKVSAYQWCMSLTARWRDSVSETSPDRAVITSAYQTLLWNYRHADTEMTLTGHGLDSSEAFKLISNPTSLFLHLYQHPSIVRRFYEPGDKYPDIHAVVDHLSEVHQQDTAKLRITMVLKLLLSADKQPDTSEDEDSTANIERIRSVAMVQESTDHQDEKDLIQLLYLLEYDNPIKQAKYLMKLISDHKNRRISNACRARAFHCLFHIIDDDEKLFKLTEKTADDLRADLRILVYLSELEAAGFKIPVVQLRQSDKSAVARSVIASSARRHNPLALRAAAEMCREFGAVPPDTWTVVLQQLVTLQQVTYLQQLLPDICRIPSVRSLPCLASVWQSCVTLPLVTLTPPLDSKQREVALSAYRFLLRCPVLLRIDLASVAHRFVSLELHVLALGCLLISPGELNNARDLAKSMIHEIRKEMSELHTTDHPLLGHVLISRFLMDLK